MGLNSLHKDIENFYIDILHYAGLDYDNNKDIVIDKNEKIGEFKVNGKYVGLPYPHLLKNPQQRTILHPLNENYIKPESAFFLQYKRRLTCEINLRLADLILNIVKIASDNKEISKIREKSLIEFFMNIGNIEMDFVEKFLKVIKLSQEKNDEEFIVGIYLNKNPSIKNKNASAIGKITFNLYNEVVNALNNDESDYRVYNYKMRKKDLVFLKNLFENIFPNIDDKNEYTEVTENKMFRYLSVLLRISYRITHIINNFFKLLGKDTNNKDLEEMIFDHNWVNSLNKIPDIIDEIRLIPNQDEPHLENKLQESESNRLNFNEEKLSRVEQNNTIYKPTPTPNTTIEQPIVNNVNPVIQNTQNQSQQVVKQLSAEDILKLESRGLSNPQVNMPSPVMPQPYMVNQLQYPQQMQPPVPMWVRQEMMSQQMQQYPQSNYLQPTHPNMQYPQGMYPQGMPPQVQYPQMLNQPPMYPQQMGPMYPPFRYSGG